MFLPIFVSGVRSYESAGNEIRSKAVPFWKALPSQRILINTVSLGFGQVNRNIPIMIIIMEIPRGNSREDNKARREIIKEYYANWMLEHPDRRVWNTSLKDYIYVKFHSLNEVLGHAPRSYMATTAQMHLTEILSDAFLETIRPPKYGDNNQKRYSRMVFLKWKSCRVLVGKRKTTGEYELYYISGGQKNKAVR